ncbi:hypothetical protein [Streptomyces atroolivaceus]|uniref:hypothetical protein n=1 Tax=Streptomyces atroolivaceus TaxID=66869 RepID=UPI0020244733|nr:hypothetical protein [Streptomyces atroolivaceus]
MAASTTSPPDRSFRVVAPVIALCWLAVFFDGMDVNIYGATMPHLLADESLGSLPRRPAPSAVGPPSAC